ncbi:hypothetical protein EC968_005346 [Mortierella alpina]|nr:hypothetical protein EC968_005346 [Mortierella alpina]
MRLRQYDYVIAHVRGVVNIADFGSRALSNAENDDDQEGVGYDDRDGTEVALLGYEDDEEEPWHLVNALDTPNPAAYYEDREAVREAQVLRREKAADEVYGMDYPS